MEEWRKQIHADRAQRIDNIFKGIEGGSMELKKAKEKDPRLTRAGVEGFNKPKRTPSHPTKSHVVVAKEGDKVKTIRFGEQGASTAGDPKRVKVKK